MVRGWEEVECWSVEDCIRPRSVCVIKSCPRECLSLHGSFFFLKNSKNTCIDIA